jgi:GntR family transcriptional regulator, sialic acid-inducible nan operon repressor
METERIVKQKLSDVVLDRLKNIVIAGDMKPGDLMPSERELMERFGVGRPAIREAMQALSGMGLVAISHGERARVLELTPLSIIRQVDQAAHIMLSRSSQSLEHLKNARIFFERGMVRQAADKANKKQIAELRETLEDQRRFLGKADMFIAADMRFHTQIAAISGNPIFVGVCEAMLGWLKVYHCDLLLWTGKEKFTLAEHLDIIRHIEARDADAAEKALVKHLERSQGLYSLSSHG